MIRADAPRLLAFCLLACALIAGCAAPGDPTARHPIVPIAVSDLGVQQYGNAFVLTFTLPVRSTDRAALAEHPAIEIYRAALAPGPPADKKTPWRLAYTVPSEQVDLYLKGERVEFHDPLTAGDFARPAGSSMGYKIRTMVAKTQASADSNVVTARLYPAPEAPRDVHVGVAESAIVVSWTAAPLPPGASSRVYRVYRGIMEPGEEISPPDISRAKLKAGLELMGTSGSTDYHDSRFEF
jgi:hypothetical protein